LQSHPFDFSPNGFRHLIQTIKARRHSNEVYQTSTMSALLEGLYDGDVTIGELLRHGDFGLGTFNGLDGELVVLGGQAYRLRSDGTATIADPSVLTPFAVVTWFQPRNTLSVSEPCDRATLKARIDDTLESQNLMVAVRVTGHFNSMRTRTVSEQHQPYRPFIHATDDQQETTFTNVSGTLIGFRMPQFEQGISVAGYHSHFISDDRTYGGHALDYEFASGTVEFSTSSDLHLSLQHTPGFLEAQFDNDDIDNQIRKTEGG